MSLHAKSRRGFLKGLTLGGPAAALVGSAAAKVDGSQETRRRRVIGGSPNPAFSRAVVAANLAFVSGVVGQDPNGAGGISSDFETQCRRAMENLKASVEAAGSTMMEVLKCTCFLTEAGDFPAFNKVFREFFPSDPPARSTVVVKELVVPGARLEIDCIAALVA